MWQPHLWRFLGRVWNQVLAWNSATTFSIAKEVVIAPVLLLFVALWWTLRKDFYKPSAIRSRGGDVLKAFAITIVGLFALILLCCIAAVPVVVYQDHTYLVSVNGDFASANKKLVDERDEWKSKARAPSPSYGVNAPSVGP